MLQIVFLVVAAFIILVGIVLKVYEIAKGEESRCAPLVGMVLGFFFTVIAIEILALQFQ